MTRATRLPAAALLPLLLGLCGCINLGPLLSGRMEQVTVRDSPRWFERNRVALIDVEGSDPVVILGSYNWTDSGAYDNDENTLIIHDDRLAQAYYAEWQRLWSALGPERLCQQFVGYLPLALKGIGQ